MGQARKKCTQEYKDETVEPLERDLEVEELTRR
jgi:hypothetical protein